ncbi:unnamed protein product [Tetraodon nigroviridis]|uniref:(spotted green pufferfish) hypothetical protein n=1 Tax=Tetraodon nigroviridis TaxID=99883 RepID=Q4REN8_TETNG|nr:unnamed protein product [Tetraodon nigroviridis]
MANRRRLLLFCGLFLLTLIQPALQGGKCVLQVDRDAIFALWLAHKNRCSFRCLLVPEAESFIKSSAGVFNLESFCLSGLFHVI